MDEMGEMIDAQLLVGVALGALATMNDMGRTILSARHS